MTISRIQWSLFLGTLAVTSMLLLFGVASADNRSVFPVPRHSAWQEECGACHLAFAPGMLPARSWRKMMTALQDHFGTDAALRADVRDSITDLLVEHAADSSNATFATQRMARSINPVDVPLRITETPMFRYFHDEISSAIWQRERIGTPSNCPACHTRAEAGSYVDWEIRIPKQ